MLATRISHLKISTGKGVTRVGWAGPLSHSNCEPARRACFMSSMLGGTQQVKKSNFCSYH